MKSGETIGLSDARMVYTDNGAFILASMEGADGDVQVMMVAQSLSIAEPGKVPEWVINPAADTTNNRKEQS